MFVETGVIEVYTEFDGHEFIIDRLPQGSFINYESFFLDDLMSVYMRSMTNTHLKVIHKKYFDIYAARYPAFKMSMMLYEKNILFRNKSNSINYKFTGVCKTKNGKNLSKKTLEREYLLKNVVLNII